LAVHFPNPIPQLPNPALIAWESVEGAWRSLHLKPDGDEILLILIRRRLPMQLWRTHGHEQ